MPEPEDGAVGNGAPTVEDADDLGEFTDSTSNSKRTIVPGPKETGVKSKTPLVPNIRVYNPDDCANYIPLRASFRYASHSSAKGAHTSLRKKIYSLIAQKGEVRSVEAMCAELVAIGKEVKQQHDLHISGLGEMTFSDEEEENDWIRSVNTHHKECLDAAYRYVGAAKRTAQQGGATGTPVAPFGTTSTQNPSPSNTVINTAMQQPLANPVMQEPAAKQVVQYKKTESDWGSARSQTSSRRSRVSTKASLAFFKREEERLAEEEEEATELDRKEAELKAAKRRLDNKRQLNALLANINQLALEEGLGSDADSIILGESGRLSKAASSRTWIQTHHFQQGAVLKPPRQRTPPRKTAILVDPATSPSRQRHKTPPREPRNKTPTREPRHKTPPRKTSRIATPSTPSSKALADAKFKSWIQQKSTGRLRQTTSDAMLALLPRHKIDIFEGNYMKWPSFISSFKHLVHDVVSSDAQRFAILIGYLGPRVRDELGHTLSDPSQYWNALQELEDTYGHPHFIAKAYLDDLMAHGTVQERDSKSLLTFIQKLHGVVTVLTDHGFEHELRSGVILGNLLAKLPFWVQTKWSRYAFGQMESYGSILDVEDLALWLRNLAMAQRMLTLSKPFETPQNDEKEHQHKQNKKESRQPKDHAHESKYANFTPTLLATSVPEVEPKPTPTVFYPLKEKCFVCGGPKHSMFTCATFTTMDIPARAKLVSNNMRCFSCLGTGHSLKDCPSTFRCRIEGCGGKHNTLLHDPAAKKATTGASKATPGASRPSIESSTYVKSPGPKGKPATIPAIKLPGFESEQSSKVALRAILKLEFRRKGYSVQTHALLDNAANGSLLREDIAAALRVPGRNRPTRFNTFHNQDLFVQSRMADFEIAIPGGKVICTVVGYTTPELHLDCHTLDWDRAVVKWPYLATLPAPAPPNCDIGALIGMDVVRAHLQRDLIEPPAGIDGPYAIKTDLGWCVIGPVDESYISSTAPKTLASPTPSCFSIACADSSLQSSDDSLHETVLNYFKLEAATTRPASTMKLTKLEQRAVDIAESTIVHEKIGDMYEVGLPLISDDETFIDNRLQAVSMLERQQSRFKKDPSYGELYSKEIEQYEKMGFSRRLSPEEVNQEGNKWYLTHHGVTNEFKPGRVRVVFNASASFKGFCLNKRLLPGPNLLNDLPGVITRFREYKHAVSSDIVKFFHHVKVPLKDQQLLRYMWRNPKVTGPTETFCMTRHPFGAASSPFLCQFVLHRAANDSSKDLPSAAERVKNNFYVDNYMDSFDTLKEAKSTCKDIIELLRRAGLKINEWSSNSKDLLAHLHSSDLVVPYIDLDADPLPTGRMLGVRLNPNTDTFGYKIKVNPDVKTKREILSEVATQYDPLGWLAPVTITARILLQNVWLSGTGWDEPVAPKLLSLWQSWASALHLVENLAIPRLLTPTTDGIELHAYCDASEAAYGCVLYARSEVDDKVHVNIIASRSKVAPIKPMTIPKLELQAAVLAVRMVSHYMWEIRLPIKGITFWSDSETTLRRIWSDKCKFQAFEANRIGEIRESFNGNQFRHVPGILNPADELTRGVPPAEFTSSHRFIIGPPHLHGKKEDFPPILPHSEPVNDDCVKAPLWIDAIGVGTPRPISDLINKSSDLVQLKRKMAHIAHFILRRKRKETDATTVPTSPRVSDMAAGLTLCLKVLQEESFYEELLALKKRRYVHPSSRLATLTPFLDKDGVIRAGGRLKRAPLPFSGRHPIILAPDHHLTRLIIEHYHHVYFHASVERLLGELRQHYHIIGARRILRSVVRSCIQCRKASASPKPPLMGDLPTARLSPEYPFTSTATDYFGPLYVKQGRSVIKRYGVLFTCMATRAVHLEIAHSLDQSSFINAYRRFVAIRGRPRVVYSDNGTNLVAGERELRQALEEWDPAVIERFMVNKGTTWQFSPPSSPHFGGVWERLVKSCKSALRSVLLNQTVTDEVLSTVIAEVSALLNSRPLTHVSVDPADLEPLTPNHFLLGRPQPDLPPAPFAELTNKPTKKQWRHAQALTDQFWRRWMEEYVPSLIERRKWNRPNQHIQKDDLVLIVDQNTPRGLWPMGRVLNIHPGDDGVVRVAEVKTGTGVYTRPATKLCLLLQASPEDQPEEAPSSS